MIHILVGKTITRIELTKDREVICFHIKGGEPVVARCDGDCCSHTWIEDFLNADALIGTPVVEVNDLDLPGELQHPTKTDNCEEEMSYYGLQIKTASGTATIAYRNSSNGYYGGSLSFLDGQNVADEVADESEWEPVA